MKITAILEALIELREARDKRNAQRSRGKVDLALTYRINELDQEVMEWEAQELRGLLEQAQKLEGRGS